MNTEQLNQLKPDDEIFIRARYKCILGDGDVLFLHSASNGYDEVVEETDYTHPENVILPSSAPKYDPCRRFKKGDEVRVVVWNGRTCLRDGQVGFVVRDEDASGMVELSIDGWKNGVFYHACHLELVTPVEELDPFYINMFQSEVHQNRNCFAIKTREHEHILRFFYTSDFETMEQTKAAAEAERDRLNAEYRKEQNNDRNAHEPMEESL